MSDHADDRLADFADEMGVHTLKAPPSELAKLEALRPLPWFNEHGMFVCRVQFGLRRFDLATPNDTKAAWVLAIPVIEHHVIVDYCAMALDGTRRMACWREPRAALGFHRGKWELLECGRVRVFAFAHKWLRAGCEGVLPLDHRLFALRVLAVAENVTLVADDAEQQRIVTTELARHVRPPHVVLLRDTDAEVAS